MDLSEEQKRILSRKLEEWAELAGDCVFCGGTQWHVSEKVFQLNEFYEGASLTIGGAVLPVIPVSCARCGNTRLLNAITLGVVAPDSVEDEAEDAEAVEGAPGADVGGR